VSVSLQEQIMYRIALAIVLGAATCGAARADGPPPAPIGGGSGLFQMIPTWTGFYLGGTGGYGTGRFQMTVPPNYAPGGNPRMRPEVWAA
jgi:hypothetical protein